MRNIFGLVAVEANISPYQAAKQYYLDSGKISKQIFNYYLSLDNSPRKEFLALICDSYRGKELDEFAEKQVKVASTAYGGLVQKRVVKPIEFNRGNSNYNLNDLLELVLEKIHYMKQGGNTEYVFNNRLSKLRAGTDYTPIYKDDSWWVGIPLNFNAAKLIGGRLSPLEEHDCHWCTSLHSSDFINHTEENYLIYCINFKDPSVRFCFEVNKESHTVFRVWDVDDDSGDESMAGSKLSGIVERYIKPLREEFLTKNPLKAFLVSICENPRFNYSSGLWDADVLRLSSGSVKKILQYGIKFVNVDTLQIEGVNFKINDDLVLPVGKVQDLLLKDCSGYLNMDRISSVDNMTVYENKLVHLGLGRWNLSNLEIRSIPPDLDCSRVNKLGSINISHTEVKYLGFLQYAATSKVKIGFCKVNLYQPAVISSAIGTVQFNKCQLITPSFSFKNSNDKLDVYIYDCELPNGLCGFKGAIDYLVVDECNYGKDAHANYDLQIKTMVFQNTRIDQRRLVNPFAESVGYLCLDYTYLSSLNSLPKITNKLELKNFDLSNIDDYNGFPVYLEDVVLNGRKYTGKEALDILGEK